MITDQNPVSNFMDDGADIFADQSHTKKFVIPADAPVLPSLAQRGAVELVVKDDGNALVLFDSKLPDSVHWVEYDMDVDSLTFVTWKGAIFTLGMKVHKPMRRYLSRRHDINLVQMDGPQEEMNIKMIDRVPMVVRRIGI